MHFLTLATYAHAAVATLSLWKSDYDSNTCVSSVAAIYLVTAGVAWLVSQFIGVGAYTVQKVLKDEGKSCHLTLRDIFV